MNERVNDLIVQKSFSICGCPIKIIKEFKDFCIDETKNDYSMGLKVLLERNTINFQQELFAMKILELENKMGRLEPKEEEKLKVKTFGKKEVNEVEQIK